MISSQDLLVSKTVSRLRRFVPWNFSIIMAFPCQPLHISTCFLFSTPFSLLSTLAHTLDLSTHTTHTLVKMGKKTTSVLVAVFAVIIGFLAMRSSETLRFVGDEAKPGILDLFTNSFIRHKVENSAEEFHNRNTRLADGSIKEQDSGMVEHYYNIVTDFYEYGWGQSFHFAHTLKDEDFEASLVRHERHLADKVDIKSNHNVIDVGCGVGGPARNIHAYTGADITGVTINEYQVLRAQRHTAALNYSNKVHFKRMDFTQLDFPENTFDRAYSIEATCHATDLADVYGQVFKVLKPGGLFGSYEWLTTAKTDMKNPEHQQIMRDIEYGSGLPPMHSFRDVEIAAKKVGFEIVYEHDLALDVEGTRPWYGKLDMSYVSTTITHYFTLFMETIGLAAKGSARAHTMLLHAVDGLVAGGRTGTFTPMHLVVFRKPLTTAPASAAAPAAAPKVAAAAKP